MDDELLVHELKQVLDACAATGISVFVVGAFSVRAYDSLFRASYDLDLALTSKHWPKLKGVLEAMGYTVTPENVWVTATKSVGSSEIEINIALNEVTDLDSATAYPLAFHLPEYHKSGDLDFALPVLPLEAVILTKLIAFRDQDFADLVGLWLQRGMDISPERFWRFTRAAGVTRQIRGRLQQALDYLQGGEALSIWYDRTGELLKDTERDLAITLVRRLLNSQALE